MGPRTAAAQDMGKVIAPHRAINEINAGWAGNLLKHGMYAVFMVSWIIRAGCIRTVLATNEKAHSIASFWFMGWDCWN